MDNTIFFHSTEYSDLWIVFRWIVVRQSPTPPPPPSTCPVIVIERYFWKCTLSSIRNVKFIKWVSRICLSRLFVFYFLSQYSFHDRSSEGILNLTPKPPSPPSFNRGLLGGSSRAVLLKSCKAFFYIQEIEDRYNMITVSVNKTKRLVLFARTRAHICSSSSRFWLE